MERLKTFGVKLALVCIALIKLPFILMTWVGINIGLLLTCLGRKLAVFYEWGSFNDAFNEGMDYNIYNAETMIECYEELKI